MPNIRKDEEANKIYKEYIKGYSLSQIGKMFSVSRQSVFVLLKNEKL